MRIKLAVILTLRKLLRQMRVSIQSRVNSSVAATSWDTSIPCLHVDFSSNSCSTQFNSLFLNNGLNGTLQEKDFRAVSMVFPIIAAYTDRETGFQNDANVTGVHFMYSNTVSKLVSQNYG